jgi:hypothetical protein
MVMEFFHCRVVSRTRKYADFAKLASTPFAFFSSWLFAATTNADEPPVCRRPSMGHYEVTLLWPQVVGSAHEHERRLNIAY